MLWILLSMACSVGIALLFKYYDRLQLDLLPVLFWNYIVCFVIGLALWMQSDKALMSFSGKWPLFSVLLGCMFVTGFFVMGKTISHYGVMVGSVSQKMSLIISAGFGILYFGEPLTALKFTGIFLAIIAVIMINIPQNDTRRFWYLLLAAFALLPMLNLLIAGGIESLLHYTEIAVLPDDSMAMRLAFLTGIFFCSSGITLCWAWMSKGNIFLKSGRNNMFAGVALGVPNFFAAYFILMAIGSGIEGSIVFPVLNSGVILLSAVFAVLIFSEPLSKFRLAGLVLALLAVFILSGQAEA